MKTVRYLKRKGSYEFRPTKAVRICTNGKFKWLKKLAKWYLEKTGCITPHFEQMEVYDYTAVEREKLTKNILEHIDKLLAIEVFKGTNPNDLVILFGPAQMNELAREWKPSETRFDIGPLSFYHDGRQNRIYGLQAYLLTNLDGVVLVSKKTLGITDDD